MSHDYTDMLNSQTIVKPKELEEVDYALRNRDSLRRPTDPLTEQRKKYEMEGSVPHGKCKPTDLVDIVTVSKSGIEISFVVNSKMLYLLKLSSVEHTEPVLSLLSYLL